MVMSGILLVVTLGFYLTAGVLFVVGLATGRRTAGTSAFALGAAGLGIQTVAIVIRTIDLHTAPFTNLFGSLVSFAWAIMAVYLVMERGQRIAAVGAFACLISSACIGAGLFIPREISQTLIPALKSPWSSVHIGSCLIAYAGFVLAFGSALAYGLQERLLKAKRINSVQRHLPPLDVLDQFSYRMVAFSFPMLTLGIITGALWAQSAWGSYWNWDPKEVWALITWLVYAVYLHLRLMQGWRGRWANRLLLTGFACIIITFLGVNLLSHGLHKYNW
jgi:cytochrome c-type biogenesis protein CcsB